MDAIFNSAPVHGSDDATHFHWLLILTGAVGVVTAIIIPLITWRLQKRTVLQLLSDDDYYVNANLNWGLMQSHRTYGATRSTISDTYLALRTSIRHFLQVCCAVSVACSVCAAAAAGAMFYAWEHDKWFFSVAVAAVLLITAMLSVAGHALGTVITVNAVTAMSLFIGASPTVDLTPMLASSERVSLVSSVVISSGRVGVALLGGTVALCAGLIVNSREIVTIAQLLTLLCSAAAGHHIGCGVANIASISLHHTVDDAIDLRDEPGRHSMSHAILASTIVGTSNSIPTLIAALCLDAAVAFILAFQASTWAHFTLPFGIIACVLVETILVNAVVHALPWCSDLVNSDTIPRRCHSILWLTTGSALAISYGLFAAVDVDNIGPVFGFLCVGAGVTFVFVETAQFLARGPLVRFVCKASVNASASAALLSVESITLVPALVIAVAGVGIAITLGGKHYGGPAIGAMAIGAAIPTLSLMAMHGMGSQASCVAIVSKMVPFSAEQLGGVAVYRPPREQAALASTVATAMSSTVACAILIIATSTGLVQWQCVVAGALFDSVIACLTTVASVGAQARMEPKDKYGYNIPMSIVPRSTPGREVPTDRPPHVVMETVNDNVWWCCLLAPWSIVIAVGGVAVIGYAGGVSYALSAVAGAVVASHSASVRAALAAQTMRALHTSGQRGKLGAIHDPVTSATVDVIHARRVAHQTVAASLVVSAALLAVVGLAPTFKML